MVSLNPPRDDTVYQTVKSLRCDLPLLFASLDDLNADVVAVTLKAEKLAREYGDFKARLDQLALLLCAPRVVVMGVGSDR